jgi:hypothetical protein
MADDIKPADVPDTSAHDLPASTIAEVHPPVARPAPEVKDEPVDPSWKKPDYLPGWPRVRFNPVHGRKEFKDPYEAAEYGQSDEEGPWRFKTAAEADMARTDTEAQIVIHQNLRAKVDDHHNNGRTVVQNSATATEARHDGYAEPGLETETGED